MTSEQRSEAPKVVDVAPELLARWLEEGDTVLVDVREDFEHASERIAQSHLVPLSRFDPEQVRSRFAGKKVVFHCRTGKRSGDAARRFASEDGPAFRLTGGIEAWRRAGHECERSASAPRLDIMRQVQLTAGSLVAIGVGLSAIVSPWFLILPGFIGCGLVFAGATGWCGMARMLALMPWNRVRPAPGVSAAARTA